MDTTKIPRPSSSCARSHFCSYFFCRNIVTHIHEFFLFRGTGSKVVLSTVAEGVRYKSGRMILAP